MIRKITIVLLILVSVSALSQEKFRYGVKGGVNISTIKRTNGFGFINYSPRVGYNIGAFGEYFLNEKISLQTELIYSLQGAKFEEIEFRESADSPAIVNSDLGVKEDYLLIPFLVKYNIKGFNFFTGPQLGILISSETKNINLFNEGSVVSTSKNDAGSSIDFALAFGLGYNFEIGLFLDARYNLGLSNTIDADDATVKEKSRVFQFSLGYKF